MRGYRVERKGGWDCHGLPVEIAVEQKLGIKSKAEIEEYGIERVQRAVPRVGVRVPGGVEPADRADRLLDRPRRTPTARWTRATSSRCGGRWRRSTERGLLYEGHKVVPVLPALRDDAVLARGRARLPGRGRPERVPEAAGRAAARSGCWSGRRRRGRCRATWRWRSRPTATLRDGARRAARCFVLAEDRVERGARRGRRDRSSASRGAELVERYGAYEGPIFAADRPRAGRAADPRRRLRDDRGRHGHRAPRAGLRRGRLPRRGGAPGSVRPRRPATRCTTRCRPDGTYDERVRSRDGELLRGALRQGPGS